MWSGQTVGKRLLRLRVLGDRGEPVTVTQVAIRNLLRLVDFLPFFYGIGIVTLFIQGGSKRLGDFAAGTVVVRDRERIRLKDLVTPAAEEPPPSEPQPGVSIWANAGASMAAQSGAGLSADQRLSPSVQAPTQATPYEDAVRRMPDALRRFVVAYARRRYELTEARRQQLAEQAAAPLGRLLRAEVDSFGALAVLDGLAGLVYTPPPSTSPLPPPV